MERNKTSNKAVVFYVMAELPTGVRIKRPITYEEFGRLDEKTKLAVRIACVQEALQLEE